jgi:hypothetical protein
VVLAHYSDQVLNATLLMADRLLGKKVEDLRRKVLELAAIIGEPDLDEFRPEGYGGWFGPPPDLPYRYHLND